MTTEPMTRGLRVSRTYPVDTARVFAAWTTPELIRRWYAPHDDWTTPVAEVDLRVGGRYRFGLARPGHEPFYEEGEFLEVVAGERLVYTQHTVGGGTAEGEQILVTVEFIARGSSTEVVVTEEGYADAAVRDVHQRGWEGFLDRLGALIP